MMADEDDGPVEATPGRASVQASPYERERAERAVEQDELDYFGDLPGPRLQSILDDPENWILAVACGAGRSSIVEYLLQQGADPNRKDPGGSTMLTCCVTYDHARCMDSLLAHRADPFATNHMGRDALRQAVAHNAHDCVRSLLPLYEGRLDQRDEQGYAALTLAIIFGEGDLESATMLVDAGASVSVRDDVGYTLLHHALLDEAPNAGVVAFLLERGAPAPNPLPDGRRLEELTVTKRVRTLLRRAGLLSS